MCPLRIIVIFLSATLAGFFVLKNFISEPQPSDDHVDHHQSSDSEDEDSFKVGSALKSGFWTCVDMASGRYLWRLLVPSKTSD